MRTSRSILVFTIVNLICGGLFIFMLPDNVIFGITGNLHASQYISRWYNLIIPIVQVISALVIYLLDVFAPKYHKYRYLIAWVAIAFTTYLMWVLMMLQYSNHLLATDLTWPWTIIIVFPIDMFLLAEGFYATQKDKDDFSIFGFRWVRESSLVWNETHKIAGWSLIVVAMTQLVLAVLNELYWSVWWIYLIMLAIWVVAHWLYTYLCALNYGKRYGTR